MTQRVVEVFEVIQVEQKQADSRTAAAGKAQRLSQPLLEQDPVRQAGQPVVVGQVFDPFLSPFALGDIHRSADRTRGPADRIPNRGGADQDIEPGTIVERDADFLAIYKLAARGPL